VKGGISVKYLCLFMGLLVVLILIALFGSGAVRGYLGDVLVILLLYFLIRAFIRNELRWLWLWLFGLGVLVELAQLFQLASLLGLDQFRVLRIVLGSTFDLWDIICYLIGSLMILVAETLSRHRARV